MVMVRADGGVYTKGRKGLMARSMGPKERAWMEEGAEEEGAGEVVEGRRVGGERGIREREGEGKSAG